MNKPIEIPDHFERFVLKLERIDGGYRARAGRKSADLSPFPDTDTWESTAPSGKDRDVRRRTPEPANSSTRGKELFQWVFRGEVLAAFRVALEKVRADKRGLTLCIQLDDAPELWTLPWEGLLDPDNERFLAENADLLIARTLAKVEDRAVEPVHGPPKVLAVLPQPKDSVEISGREEWESIQKTLKPLVDEGRLRAERLEPPVTLDALRSSLAADPCEVLHIAAHGEPGSQDEKGIVYLEDEYRKKADVRGSELCSALMRSTPPRLVILSSCHGAHAQVDEAYDGLAQHLVHQGIGAVVAMRSTISDDAAVKFAGFLYSYLAQGQSLENAMVQARGDFITSHERREWAIPVLYLGKSAVRLVDPAPKTKPLRKALAVAALGALATLGWWALSPTEPLPPQGPCSPAPGLEDMPFVFVEAGFVDVEGTRRTVERSFCISKYEVTQQLWQDVTGELKDRKYSEPTWPVTSVSFEEAVAFTDRLSKHLGGFTYRLPTEVEWLLAARAESDGAYHFGDDESLLAKYGNCRNMLSSDGRESPAPVGSYKANDFGLHDVHGNVAEWVYAVDEQGQRIIPNSETKYLKVGGSYANVIKNCTLDARKSVKAGNDEVGFRVVREIPLAEDSE